jgi:hypothetical protein
MTWDVIFCATADGSVPGADFLDGCPAKVRGTILAVLDAVAAAPPPAFAGRPSRRRSICSTSCPSSAFAASLSISSSVMGTPLAVLP